MKISKLLLLAGGLFIFSGNLPRANGGVQFTTLFAFNGTNGDSPEQIVQGVDGALYGATFAGGIGCDGTSGSGNGTVFRLALDGSFTNTVLFNVTNGLWGGILIRGQDNNLYGTTIAGNGGNGTVFMLSTNGALINPTLATFNGTDGSYPIRLMQGNDGDLYGVTQFGGSGYFLPGSGLAAR